MKLRTFFGLTSRSVLDQVRCELGADAMIVANRATADGIEVTAVAAGAIDSLLREPAPTPSADTAQPPRVQAALPDQPDIKPWHPPVMSAAPASEAPPAIAPPAAAPAAATDAGLGARVMDEMAA